MRPFALMGWDVCMLFGLTHSPSELAYSIFVWYNYGVICKFELSTRTAH